jgi:hypothetical protein
MDMASLRLLIDCIDAVQSVLKKEMETLQPLQIEKKKKKVDIKKRREKDDSDDEEEKKEAYSFLKENFDEERAHFIKNILEPMSVEHTFKNGEEATVVYALPRKLWPLKQNGEKYLKVQELCEDFKIEFRHDEGPQIYILVPEIE